MAQVNISFKIIKQVSYFCTQKQIFYFDLNFALFQNEI